MVRTWENVGLERTGRETIRASIWFDDHNLFLADGACVAPPQHSHCKNLHVRLYEHIILTHPTDTREEATGWQYLQI